MLQDGAAYPTILVVDDSEDTRLVLMLALGAKGYHVLEARGRIRECKELCQSAPILAITAFDTYGIEEAALEVGCNGYIRKPLDGDEVDRVLRSFLPEW